MSRDLCALLYLSESSHLKRRFYAREDKKKNSANNIIKKKCPYMLLIKRPTYDSLKEDPATFEKDFKMSPTTFKYFLNIIEEDLTKEINSHGRLMSPELKLMLTIRFLASNLPLQSLANYFRVEKSCVNETVKEVCDALYKCLAPRHMPPPNRHTYLEVSHKFKSKWKFPNCIGCVDSRLISWKFKEPGLTGIFLQGIADPEYRFIMIDILPSTNDFEPTFNDTTFFKGVNENRLELPTDVDGNFKTTTVDGWKVISGLPFIFLGDVKCPLVPKIIKPYTRSMDTGKKIFNEKLSHALQSVLSAFDLLAHRWTVLTGIIDISQEDAISIIKATVVLHNTIIDLESIKEERVKSIRSPAFTLKLNGCLGVGKVSYSPKANRIRDTYVDYFIR